MPPEPLRLRLRPNPEAMDESTAQADGDIVSAQAGGDNVAAQPEGDGENPQARAQVVLGRAGMMAAKANQGPTKVKVKGRSQRS